MTGTTGRPVTMMCTGHQGGRCSTQELPPGSQCTLTANLLWSLPLFFPLASRPRLAWPRLGLGEMAPNGHDRRPGLGTPPMHEFVHRASSSFISDNMYSNSNSLVTGEGLYILVTICDSNHFSALVLMPLTSLCFSLD